MAGKVELRGEMLERALEMLQRVATTLDALNVRYWLESGTLLGVIRERRLLPWDTDIDLSIRSDDLPVLLENLHRLRRQGYRVRVRSQETDDGPLRKGDPRIIKIRSRRWLFFRGPLLIDIFVKYRHGDHYYWSIGRGTVVTKRVPAHFYDTLDSVEFDGRHYPVPGRTEEYLAARYGDWRTPKREWNIFRDDAAIATTMGTD